MSHQLAPASIDNVVCGMYVGLLLSLTHLAYLLLAVASDNSLVIPVQPAMSHTVH